MRLLKRYFPGRLVSCVSHTEMLIPFVYWLHIVQYYVSDG